MIASRQPTSRVDRPGVGLDEVRNSLRFMNPRLLDKYIAGLRLAGMP